MAVTFLTNEDEKRILDEANAGKLLTSPQELTEEEKAQARTNICAVSQSEVDRLRLWIKEGEVVLNDRKDGTYRTLCADNGKLRMDQNTFLTNEDEQRIIEETKAGAVLYTQQDLAEDQKAQARENIGAGSKVVEDALSARLANGSVTLVDEREGVAETLFLEQDNLLMTVRGKVETVLKTGYQYLTENQKTQARNNIGAPSREEMDFLHSRLKEEQLVLTDTKTTDYHNISVQNGKLKMDGATFLTDEEQELTEEQKDQARDNIGAASVEDVAQRTEYDNFVDEDITSTLTIETGYYYGAGLTKLEAAGLSCTSLIPVKAGEKFKITSVYGYFAPLVAEFDSTQTMVSYNAFNEDENVAVTDYEYTVPSGVSYIAINNRRAGTTNIVVKKVVVDSVKHRIAELEKSGGTGTGGSADIPSALPNPHKLTFTGAVSTEYDGSEAVEVNIPAGGGSGGGAEWKHIGSTVTEEEVSTVEIINDTILNELLVRYKTPPIAEDTGGTIFACPVIVNAEGVTTAVTNNAISLKKPNTNMHICQCHFMPLAGYRLTWDVSGASAGVLAGYSGSTISAIQNAYKGGGGLIGFRIYWTLGNKLPIGVELDVWGR